MPKVSIVAPVYGVERFIDQFLQSIAEQTYQDLEVILVDDGSPDGCPAILDRFAASDERYRVIHQENGGVSVARNTGLDAASGEYVYVVDSDDWLEPAALEVLVEEADRTGADIVYGDWVRESDRNGATYVRCFPHAFVTSDHDTIRALQYAVNNNNNKVLLKRPEFDCIYHLGGAPWRGMVRRSVIEENSLRFDPYVRGLGDDILFALHLYEHVRTVAYLPKPIYHYRVIEASYSHGYKANYSETITRIFERQEAFLRENDKDDLAWKAYYTRVIIYLQQGMDRYFCSPQNPKSERERYQEFRDTIRSEPFAMAIQKAPVRYMGVLGLRAFTLALRLGMARPYWMQKVRKTSRK